MGVSAAQPSSPRATPADGPRAGAPGRGRIQPHQVVIAFGLIAAVVVLVSTARGIGITPYDSVAYLTMADEVAAGRMPYPTVAEVPSTHFPPGWSVVVGAVSAVAPAGDTMSVARVVNALFAGLLPVVVYGVLRARSRPAPWVPVLIAGYVAASYPLFELASRAVTESLFLCLLVASLLAIERLERTPSTARLIVAAALVSALTLTRFVGAVALLPLAIVVLTRTATWAQRLGRLAIVTAISLGPSAVWYVLAPGSLASSHIKGGERAGVDELLLTIEEAGVTLARGVFLPSVIRYALGLALLLGPFAVVVVTGAAPGAGSRWRRVTEYVRSRGMGPWLLFLVAYTVVVALQRWGINREVIARYWLPYWIVVAVLVGRCLVDWTARTGRAWRTAVVGAWVSLIALAGYNTAQVVTTARSNAQDGITLNAVRYQESDLLGALATGDLSIVHTDDTYLVSFQTYARGALVPVERLRCHVELVDAFIADLRADATRGEAPAVAIIGRCRETPFADELLARLDGARLEREPGLGVVIWPDG